MKKTLLALAVFGSLSLMSLNAPTVQACSPAPGYPPTAEANLAQQDIAFIGTVTSIVQDKSVNGEYRISFEVEETYKGEVEDTITVRARSSSAACGYDDGYTMFKKGTVWAIYANGDAKEGYVTDSLSLNTKYATVSEAKSELEDLGLLPVDEQGPTVCTMIYAPVCGKDAAGTIKTYGSSCTLGADKAEFLYEGECKVAVSADVPATDLWIGMRGAAVTWLQDFLTKKATGSAAASLAATGSTGYFGMLTKAALAEFQGAHGILPSAGYFGAKTREAIETMVNPVVPQTAETFTGTIESFRNDCYADGICSVTIDGKEVIITAGYRMSPPAVGSVKGVDSFGDLEKEIGSKAEVYAAKDPEFSADYTLYGNTSYYVKVLD